VTFKVEGTLNYEIKPLTHADLPVYANVIRKSFATVTDEFGWTQDSAPTFTAYTSDEKLSAKFIDGYYPFGLFVGDVLVGFVSLTDMSGGVYELNNLAVLPEWRHFGYGKLLLDHCKDKIRELGGNRLTIGIVEENTVLKCWYTVNGFKHTGTKKLEWQPFTVGFMEWEAAR
jgi:GNAT superfamily N-acetyltransferase